MVMGAPARQPPSMRGTPAAAAGAEALRTTAAESQCWKPAPSRPLRPDARGANPAGLTRLEEIGEGRGGGGRRRALYRDWRHARRARA